MTVGECLAGVDALIPNAYTRQEKLRWLSWADGEIWEELFCLGAPFPGYDEKTGDERCLLLPEPWSRGYYYWLESCIRFANGEYRKYNNAMALWQDCRSRCRNALNRRQPRPACRLRFR